MSLVNTPTSRGGDAGASTPMSLQQGMSGAPSLAQTPRKLRYAATFAGGTVISLDTCGVSLAVTPCAQSPLGASGAYGASPSPRRRESAHEDNAVAITSIAHTLAIAEGASPSTYSQRLGLQHSLKSRLESEGRGFSVAPDRALLFKDTNEGAKGGVEMSIIVARPSTKPTILTYTSGENDCPSPSLSQLPSPGGNEENPIVATRKWYVLVLTCLLLFGTDYCYDLPGAFGAGEEATIQSHFTNNGQVYNQKMNQALYSFYSYPNMVMTIVGGLLIDKYLGLRKTTLLFCVLSVTASFFFAVGVSISSYPLMVASRLMIGCSGENMFVAQSSFVSKWFGGSKVMALAFGIAVSFSRLGGAFAYILSPIAAQSAGVPAGAWVGFGMGVLSLLSTFVLLIVDYRSEKQGLVSATAGGGGHGGGSASSDKVDAAAVEEGGAVSPSSAAASTHSPAPAFLLSNIPTLPKTLWLLALGSLLCYAATFPFIGIAKTYFERVYEVDGSTASFDTSLFHLLGAVLCPLVGLVVDRVGKGPMWLAIASCGLVSAFGLMITIPNLFSAIAIMVMLSSFYSIFVAAVWSFAPFTVPDSASGFAFGVMIAATNFGLATSPLIVGAMLDAYTGDATAADAMLSDVVDTDGDLLPSAEGFRVVLCYLAVVAALAIANAFVLWRVDASSRGILMSRPSERAGLKHDRDEELVDEWRKRAEGN